MYIILCHVFIPFYLILARFINACNEVNSRHFYFSNFICFICCVSQVAARDGDVSILSFFYECIIKIENVNEALQLVILVPLANFILENES